MPRGQPVAQDRPPRVNTAGSEFVPDRLPVKPKATEEPAGTVPFQVTFFAVTAEPDCVWSAFHICVILWPSGKVQLRDQPFQAVVPVLASRTSAWKPSAHWLVIS